MLEAGRLCSKPVVVSPRFGRRRYDGVAAVARDAALPWCETAIVAGVGARTAARLIDAACDAGAPPRRFVVQPTQQHIAHARDLRSTLWARGYDVAEELWLDDNGARLRRTGRRVPQQLPQRVSKLGCGTALVALCVLERRALE